MSEFKDLVGKKVLSFLGNKDTLCFKTDAGIFTYGCEGDCCSSSWFEHVSGVPQLIGHTVISAQTIDMPDIPKEQQRDEDIAYGYQLTTDKGHFLVEMRNSSNGYYGGWVNDPSNEEPSGLPEIKEDW